VSIVVYFMIYPVSPLRGGGGGHPAECPAWSAGLIGRGGVVEPAAGHAPHGQARHAISHSRSHRGLITLARSVTGSER
jgi:hypothetical protein